MKKTHAMIVAAAALLLGAAVAFPGRPATIAVLDMQTLFPSLDEQKFLEARLKQVDDRLLAEKDRLTRELQDLNTELESYKAGTPAYNEALRKAEAAVGGVAAQEQFAKFKSEAERAGALRDIYARIKEATAAVAAELKIDIVVTSDAAAAIEPGNLQTTRAQLLMRRVVFAAPEFDITEAVAAKANAEFRKRGGTLPPPATPAAPATAPAAPGTAK